MSSVLSRDGVERQSTHPVAICHVHASETVKNIRFYVFCSACISVYVNVCAIAYMLYAARQGILHYGQSAGSITGSRAVLSALCLVVGNLANKR